MTGRPTHAKRVTDLLARLSERGVSLRAVGERIAFEGPQGALTTQDRSDIAAQRTELLAALRPALQQRPLVPAELEVWLLRQLSEVDGYTMHASFRIDGEIDAEVFQLAVDDLVSRHAALRASVAERDGSPWLVAPGTAALPVTLVEVEPMTVDMRIAEVLATPFDLARGPLFRVFLFRLGPTAHISLLTAHHIVADDFSLRLFGEQVLSGYAKLTTGIFSRDADSDLPPPVDPWQEDEVRWSRVLERRRALEDAPQMRLPSGPASSPAPARHSCTLSIQGSGLKGWQSLRRSAGVTSFPLLVAMLTIAVQAAGGPTDQLLGTSQTGRGNTQQQAIGYYARPAVARVRCDGDKSVVEHLRSVSEELDQAALFSDVPPHELVAGRAQSAAGGFALFAVAYAPLVLPRVGSLQVTAIPTRSDQVRHDLRMEARIEENAVQLGFGWRRQSVSESFVSEMLRAFARLTNDPPSPAESVGALLRRLSGTVGTVTPSKTSPTATLSDVAARRKARRGAGASAYGKTTDDTYHQRVD